MFQIKVIVHWTLIVFYSAIFSVASTGKDLNFQGEKDGSTFSRYLGREKLLEQKNDSFNAV